MNIEEILPEISFKTARSSGAGGQHVNKTETKVSLYFNIYKSDYFSKKQKQILLKKLKNRVNSKGELILSSQRYRSQAKNKKDSIQKLEKLLKEALKRQKKRKKSLPSKKYHQKRLKEKKLQAEKKQRRKKDF